MRSAILSLLLVWSGFAAAQSDTGLGELVRAGEIREARELLEQGADVNQPLADGSTALHWAVYQVEPDLVEALLRREANPDVKNIFGSTPLQEAVKVASIPMVEMLLNAGASIDAANEDGQTPLMLAIDTAVYPLVELLVERGADVNAREQWHQQSPLMWAAAQGQERTVQLLLSEGAEVSVRATVNDWPAQITSEPRAQYRPSGGLTPLLYAARSGCTVCVKAMLDAGADINRPSPDGVTALMVAIDNSHFDLARTMLDRGADPHVWDWWGRTALYVATDIQVMRPRFGAPPPSDDEYAALDIMCFLLESGVDPDPQLNMHRPGRGGGSGRFTDDLLTTGATPLLRAAVGQHAEALELLLAHGARVDLPNVMGVTPLMAAAGAGSSGRDASSDFNADSVQARAITALQVLLDHGADINSRVSDISSHTARIARRSTMTERLGQTALYGAVKWAWEDVVRFLVEQGAEVDMEDANGKSPVDAAIGDIGGRDNTPSETIESFLRSKGGQEGSGPPAEPLALQTSAPAARI